MSKQNKSEKFFNKLHEISVNGVDRLDFNKTIIKSSKNVSKKFEKSAIKQVKKQKSVEPDYKYPFPSYVN